MTVRLDLRPNRRGESEERAAKAAGYVCAASASVFILSALFFIAVCGRAHFAAKSFRMDVSENALYMERIKAAESELRALIEGERRTAEDIDFIFGGAPAIEFLDSLSFSINDGVAVEYVELTAEGALVKGAAAKEADVLLFAEALARVPSVASVGVPAITSSERGGAEIKIFSLDLRLRGVREILMSSAALVRRSA